ncbi:hypothetical protein WOC76_13145 [Methylocystis sp. IM3]|uniref:hypothetical protein n=1 Tax=unclassified Methylocystis TaxID=2625913 RepID=UPI0030FC0F1E
MPDSLAALLPSSFQTVHLVLLLFSAPVLAVWWLGFRMPLGRRRFTRNIVIAAPADAVWRLLDPLGPGGGRRLVDEARDVRVISRSPLRLSLARRPRGAERLFDIIEEDCLVDRAAGRLILDGGGVRSLVELTAAGDGTQISASYEKHVSGLWDYERTRLFLARDLFELAHDATAGEAEFPLFRFFGWRLALLRALGASVMATSALTLAGYLAREWAPVRRLADAHGASDIPLAFGVVASLIFLLLLMGVAAWAIHEFGHALASAAFRRRAKRLNIVSIQNHEPFCPRDEASAFEAGAISLAGPAFSALAIFALDLAAPAWRIDSFLAFGLLVFFKAVLLCFNTYSLIQKGSSDAEPVLDAIFGAGERNAVSKSSSAAGEAMFSTAGRGDLGALSLMVLAISWLRDRRLSALVKADWRRRALAAGLALVVGFYAYEASHMFSRAVMAGPKASQGAPGGKK